MQHYDVESPNQHRTAPTVSALLRRDIDEFIGGFRERSDLLRRAKRGEVPPEILGRYLRCIHYLIQHTLIHLELAEKRAAELGHLDLASHFAHKKSEEEGHDRWAESDMRGLAAKFGVGIPDEPTPEMRAIIAANERLIEETPQAYLAYMLFAEYVTVVLGPEWLAALTENCGIPASALSVVAKHVDLDREHVIEGCDEIDALVELQQSDALRAALAGMMARFAAFCDGLCTTR